MNKFSFDLQAFAWSHPSEGSWLYTSGSSSFYINGDYDEDEDDDGNLIPQNTSVSGSNVTIQPDWTTSISIVGGSFNFFDDYESFEAKLSSGDRAVNDSDNSVWIVNGSGYVYNSYSYYDSDITVTDLDSAPANRMTLSTISSDGFTHYSVDVNGAETSDYTAFTVGTIAFKTVSSSNDTFSIIPNIVTINFSSSGPTFVADDYDSTEYSIDNMSGIYAVYNSSTHVLNLIDGASYFSDATNLEINVDETSAGVKVVSDDFVSFVANGEYISINTNDPIYVAYDENSWVWDANANTLYFGYNLTMTGISNVSSITNITVTDDQIIINGATLNNAAIDDVTITGTDNNPSNGYIINITDDGYEFADDTPVDTPTVASISYNANGSFTFTDTNGNSVAYSTASVDFTTMRGALVLGEDSPLNITISSAADGLIIFDSSIDNTNIVAQLNSGDVFADDHIATDANTINAWAVFEDGDVGLGQNAATTISAITVDSTTTIVRDGNLISINNATLESFARINDNLISGSDTNPADGYLITISGDDASYITALPGALASIGYNGSFNFFDADGNALAYSNVSSLIATGEGGLITLGADAPDVLTVSSAVDDLIIFNNNGTRTAIMARINTGDSYVSNSITGSLNDASPINSWITNDDLNVINVGNMTLSGFSGLSSATSALFANNLLTLQNVTLNAASINGSSIAGTDDDPTDGYFISVSGSSYSFVENMIGELASIGYNGSFSFADANGNALAYSNVSSLIATGEGGLITLGADAPDILTVSSSVDDLIIYNNNGTRTAIMARINAGDSYVSNSITGSLNDASPINSWITNDDLNVLNVGSMTLSGVSGLSSATSALFANNLLTLQNVTLNTASINGSSITGSDDDPSDGYFISVSGSSYSFVENTIGELASIGYNGSFSFADANGNALAYSNVSSLIATGEGGLITLGADAPDVLTVSSSVDDLIIYNNNGTRTAIMARINAGDSYVSNSITSSLNDASPINSWITNDALNVLNVGNMTLSGVSGLSSATSALFANNLLTLQNVTLNAASINGSSISGTDDDPSDGYFISVSGSNYSFVENTIGELASIGYNGSFSFTDANGNALAYSNVSSLIATGEGGMITLGADAPDVLTVSSSVDDLIIFNNNGTQTTIMARINAGDSYVSNSITGSLNDASPINSWITNDDLNVINVGTMTLSGVSGLSSATSALFSNNLLTLQNVTLNAASINGSAIAGTDDDPSDGYFISVSGSNYSFVENTIGELASIGYNGSFSFVDANGNALAYSNVSSLIATGEGGLITLGADAPDILTVSSSVDDLIIFNNT
ncbi:MAG: hypothetical protein IJ668_08565, partial [Selenomonadaceae bacterium]|nr:hypothetical protein [Selenomonadaceae bacterium]